MDCGAHEGRTFGSGFIRFRVWGLGFRDLGFRVLRFVRFRVQSFMFQGFTYGLGFRVSSFRALGHRSLEPRNLAETLNLSYHNSILKGNTRTVYQNSIPGAKQGSPLLNSYPNPETKKKNEV